MTAQGIIASCSTGPLMVGPPALFGKGPPTNSHGGILGQEYFDTSTSPRTSYTWSGAEWLFDASGLTEVLSVTGTANQILATPTTGAVVLSLIGPFTPATFTAHGVLIGEGTGSIAATTPGTTGQVLSGVTGADPAFTSTPSVSSLTLTAGNLTVSQAASGLVLTPTVASGAASGTVAANGRVVSVTFTGVSIASGATQAFTTSNTSITGAGTVLLLTWSGATAGSALSVDSIVNSAGQSVITMTNGTSATMVTSVANITFTYLVLN